jgi:Asp-tRNA(Asn)/Glu-tRNA(Gln) amidotransferase A subunit family amidase
MLYYPLENRRAMPLDRRHFLAVCSTAGLAGTLLPGTLYTLAAQAEQQRSEAAKNPQPIAPQPITAEMLEAASSLAGVPLTAEQRAMMIDGLNQQRKSYDVIRALRIPNSVAPAYIFDPLPPGVAVETELHPIRISKAPTIAHAPSNLEDLAFLSARELSEYVRTKRVSSVALTEMYLTRLKRYDPMLHFVVTLTEERAMTQAREADREIAAGRYRGPLHGLPWGAKDLLAVKGYPATWGAAGFEHQSFDDDATVVKRLDAAGAVLVAKTTLGALAMGDKWFGGRTRNPWNLKQGSSGSSAGSASSVAAGCVAFAIGSETLGSISSPSTRCGATGLRPTFGFVPRTGAMALSWTMDKLGALCRAVEDCAIVMDTIHGPDGKDLATRDAAFTWNAEFDWRTLRVGYLKDAFESDHPQATGKPPVSETEIEKQKRLTAERERAAARVRREYDRRYDLAALDKLRAMGVDLKPVALPNLPYEAMSPLLTAEAAAAFDDLTMSGRDKLLTEQSADDWPNLFRIARFYPAVEYIQANRARTLAIQQMAALFQEVDVIVTPSGGDQLVATNLTGHPAVIVPNGIRGNDAPVPPKVDDGDDDSIGGPGTPVSLTFLGGLYQDAKLCAFARAYQESTGFQKLHPALG